jgi:ferric-dicitrate binding protein FerR (iron transport regulator)
VLRHVLREAADRRGRRRSAGVALAIVLVAAAVFWLVPPLT